ncbi:3,4-dihydroxy-2-butanone-4-phosphate synthase [Streptomyces sp. NBC_00820]|uniref:3,4-dihydroxy-2-butanone-4-phosphate synthase n=1 Tax=Streptomyces sp. NBC_00820 TaxID=2975842 RepID=UPI002ED4004B|nr:3,4-dihydroxy-2-butanone-4-phosphate synthase [Streptomyces sp. NBC_00820]
MTSVSVPGPGTVPDTVMGAVEELRRGRPVIVVDAVDRENEGDLVMAAQFATAEAVGFFVRWTSGLICSPMAPEVAERLGLPLMVPHAGGVEATAFTVSVDAAGTGSGIGTADRALTLRTLADPGSGPERLIRPGHVFPLRARPGGHPPRTPRTASAPPPPPA